MASAPMIEFLRRHEERRLADQIIARASRYFNETLCSMPQPTRYFYLWRAVSLSRQVVLSELGFEQLTMVAIIEEEWSRNALIKFLFKLKYWRGKREKARRRASTSLGTAYYRTSDEDRRGKVRQLSRKLKLSF